MGKYYCDYCDIYLTHDSMNARKAHNTGRNHVANVRDYFASLGHDKAQNIIDQIIQQHEMGGRQTMMAAPSMRLGAGFMNPMMPPANFAPAPPMGAFPPQGSAPPFRPPFPPTGVPGAMPPFPPTNGAPPNGAMPPFPPAGGFRPPMGAMGSPNGAAPPPQAAMPPTSNFTPLQGPPPAGSVGVHPDRLRMMGM